MHECNSGAYVRAMALTTIRLRETTTGSTWAIVFASLHDSASKLGLTNRAAVAVIAAARELGFPLWYVYAAEAYGWERPGDVVVPGDMASERQYAGDMRDGMWLALDELAARLDSEGRADPRLQLVDVYDDMTFVAEVSNAINSDGAARKPRRMRRVNVGDAPATAKASNSMVIVAIALIVLVIMEDREE